MKVEYDMEKEKRNLKKKTEKILKKYPNVEDLEYMLEKILTLVDSKPFNILTKNLVNYTLKFNEIHPEEEIDIESLWEEFPILKNALVLDTSKDTSMNIFSRRSDTITYTQFGNFVNFNFGVLTVKEGDNPLYSSDRIYNLSNKVMVLLNEFDKDIHLDTMDVDFFRSLDAVRWNKDAKKLFKKMVWVLLDIPGLIIATLFSDIISDIFSTYRTTLTVLVTCSAVKNNRNIMEYEDVICAFKTFFKLIDADINDLI
ncbi:hypothetical protein [Methanobrevibacter curvatus]|uniref:Uncharacterized protein n=1 Tax=Methanobrevibacter curvatus TaxID=49547 RepID=A0A166B6I0_9EURY|nr:hypothetical protein [Methanobrevibacter curvatus]KZX12929.1 hypothetical protein MBCUR_08180 [Methanobrevibacter curvatus]